MRRHTRSIFVLLLLMAIVPCSTGDIVIGNRVGANGIADAVGRAQRVSAVAPEVGVLRERLFTVPLGYMPSFDVDQSVSFVLFDEEVAMGKVINTAMIQW